MTAASAATPSPCDDKPDVSGAVAAEIARVRERLHRIESAVCDVVQQHGADAGLCASLQDFDAAAQHLEALATFLSTLPARPKAWSAADIITALGDVGLDDVRRRLSPDLAEEPPSNDDTVFF